MNARSAIIRNTPWQLWLTGAALPVILLVFWLDPFGLRQSLTIQTIALQRDLHRDLAGAVQTTASGHPFAGLLLIGLSFLYGVFHAVGPGHGKVVISTYLATHERSLKSGIVLANLSALMQGMVALVIVALCLWFLNLSARDANQWAGYLELTSYVLVALIGLYLAWRGFQQLRSLLSAPEHHHHHHGHSHHDHHHHDHADHSHGGHQHCGHNHAVIPDDAGFVATLLSTGIRPCSGAILVLVLAASVGLWWYGAVAVLAMSIGTGLAVSVLAALVVFSRERAVALAAMMEQGEGNLARWMALLAIVGGLLVTAFGVSLIEAATATVDHPLMRR